MNLQDFINANKPKEGGERFQLENDKLLEIKVNGSVWTKVGSMVAYKGSMAFKNKSGGLGKMFKKALTGEGSTTMEVTGNGYLYVADFGKNIHVLNLGENDEITVGV